MKRIRPMNETETIMKSKPVTLSSSLTFFNKYIFIKLWVLMFGSGTVSMFLSSGNTEAPKYHFLIAWIVGTVFLYLIVGRIKKVQLRDGKFYISNYIKAIDVEFSEVKSVSGSILLNPELVWFKLRTHTRFGKTIIFMPKTRFSFHLTQHPMVEELRELCK